MTTRRRIRRLAVRYQAFMRWIVDPRDPSEIEWRAFTP